VYHAGSGGYYDYCGIGAATTGASLDAVGETRDVVAVFTSRIQAQAVTHVSTGEILHCVQSSGTSTEVTYSG